MMKKISLVLFLIAFSFGVFACEKPEPSYFLSLKADKTAACPGEVVKFTTDILGDQVETEIQYEIKSGAEYATITADGQLTIKEDAVIGQEVAVISKDAAKVSNTVSIKIEKPVYSFYLNLKADRTMACAGESIQFTTEILGDPIEAAPTYEIKSGQEFATINANGVLTINENAAVDSKIAVVSKIEDKVSNIITITVVKQLDSIVLSAEASEIIVGQSVVLKTTLEPSDAFAEAVRFEVIQGKEACSMVNNLLVVSQNAEVDTIIKVKAVSGTVESNVLEFKVISGKSERLFISLSNSFLTVDKFAGSTTLLQATVLDAELNILTDKKVVFEVIEGSEYLEATYSNNVCSFNALGHGQATVRATIEGTNYSQTAQVNVIVPPTALQLHDVFADRVGYEYNYSKVDALKFPVLILGENVCESFELSFKDALGNTGDAVATYNPETQEITFVATGEVTVTATSNSGSRREASVSYTFNINEGINVYTYEQLKSTLESANYNGEIVNIVVLEKPTTDAYAYTYGYDLVPSFALKAQSEQTFASVTSERLGSICVNNKNVYINGNQHKIDLTNVRTFSNQELTTTGWSDNQITPALMISHTVGGLQLDVKLYDLTILGNCAIDYKGDLSGKTPVGAYARGIQIGADYEVDNLLSAYYLDMQNVTVGQFNTGMRIYHVVNNGLAKNINVYNCFGNGIESYANVMTFENMTYGLCGAAGIELTPNYDDAAGTSFNQPQHVTFAGTINTTNYTTGNSLYMQNFNAMGYSVMQILQGVFSQYSPEVLSNVRNSNGEFVFVSFIFNDLSTMELNNSIYEYKNIDGAGIVNINDLTGVDTTHKYIEVNVVVGGYPVGTVLVYNFNYAGK